MKKFSFVIPTYNRNDLLINTLEALNQQQGFTADDYEVIVVDDGSTPEAYPEIKGINTNYEMKHIFLNRDHQSCVARARNAGWRSAEGEVVIFIDSDIIVKNNYLQELERCFSLDPDVLVIGTRLMLQEKITRDSIRDGSFFEQYKDAVNNLKLHEFRYIVFNASSYNTSYLFYPWLVAFTCNMAMPRRCLEEIGGLDENFLTWGIEDVELAYRVYRHGTKIILGHNLEVFHQFHDTGTDEITPEKIAGIERNVKHFLEKHPKALNLPKESVYDLFKGQLRFDQTRHQDSKVQKILNFRDKEALEPLKQEIIELSDREGLELIINDWVEDTDLDLWIQLLGTRKSTPFYLPLRSKTFLRGRRLHPKVKRWLRRLLGYAHTVAKEQEIPEGRG